MKTRTLGDVLGPRSLHCIVGLLAGVLLLLQVFFTRIFSVTLYHHFAFVAVSIGMLGLAAAGVRVNWMSRKGEGFKVETFAWYMHLFSLSTITAVLLLVRMGANGENSWLGSLTIVGVYFVCFFPFFCGGIALTLLFTQFQKNFSKLYATDLVSAGLCAILVPPVISVLGAPKAIVVLTIISELSLLFLYRSIKWLHRAVFGAIVAVSISVFVGSYYSDLVSIRGPKGRQDDSDIIFEKWNSFSRVAVYERDGGTWSLGSKFQGVINLNFAFEIGSAGQTPPA